MVPSFFCRVCGKKIINNNFINAPCPHCGLIGKDADEFERKTSERIKRIDQREIQARQKRRAEMESQKNKLFHIKY